MPKPFAVLRYMVEHPGRLVTNDQLLRAISGLWSPPATGTGSRRRVGTGRTISWGGNVRGWASL